LATEKNWETDIRLIQSDIKQIQKFFNKVETSMDVMVDLSKNVAVQSEVIAFTKEKLEEIERTVDETRKTEDLRLQVLSDRLEEYRRSSRGDHEKLAQHNAEKRAMSNKEILEKLEIMERGLHSRINDQTKKISTLENWRYYIMGVSAVIMFFFAKWSWPDLFG
jgi:hypothetical protein